MLLFPPRERLQVGLSRLSEAESLVGTMQEELVTLGPRIEEKAKVWRWFKHQKFSISLSSFWSSQYCYQARKVRPYLMYFFLQHCHNWKSSRFQQELRPE
jgi:hypothetical protein